MKTIKVDMGFSRRASKAAAVSLLAMTVLVALCAGGCAGRREALMAAQRLKLTSEQAAAVVTQAKTNEASSLEAQRGVREAYRQLVGKTWQSLLESHQRALEVEYRKAVADLEAERARLLEERQKEQERVLSSLEDKLNESLAEVDRSEATAERDAIEARKKSKESPGDLPLLQKSLEADVTYFALAAKARDMELRARIRAQKEMNQADIMFQERLQSLTKAQREKLLATYTTAREKLSSQEMPPVDLGPEPEANGAFLDSLVQYLASVQQAGRAFEDYLESNWFGRGSFLSDFLRSASGGVISGVFKPAASLKDAFAGLRDAAKGVGQEFLSEVKDAGKAAKETLASEGQDIKTRLTEELLNKLARTSSEAKRDAKR